MQVIDRVNLDFGRSIRFILTVWNVVLVMMDTARRERVGIDVFSANRTFLLCAQLHYTKLL